MEKSRKPKIRFKGYNDDWEQRELGELYQKNTEKNEDLIGYDKTISIATMTYKGEGNGASDNSLRAYKVLRTGDLAFEGHTNKEFRYGRFVANDIGIGIMSPRFSTLRPKNDMPIIFWKYYIHYEPVMKSVLVNSTKAGTMMNELVISEFMTQPIFIPSYEEQKKIGAYLDQIDQLITLHQRKLDKLINVKKSMLENMFPKQGSTVPEIRFNGFTQAWEQCKFRDIGSVSMCRRIFKEQTSLSGDVPFYKIGTFGAEPDAFISKKLFEEYKLKYPYPNKGDILISASGSIGKTVEYTGENEYFQDSNIVWLKHEDYIKNSFLKCYYSIVKWSGIEGSTIKRLYNENILNTSISVPSEMEQEQLGVFFENIELLITLHQRKLEKLKNIKKSMLEKMFV